MSDILGACGHGRTWKEDCPDCERVWDLSFLSDAQKQLAAFYNVTTKDALIDALSHHVDKLQAKHPGIDLSVRTVAREG